MKPRINNYNSCIVCGRLPDGLAVGSPSRLGWYCADCGPETARKAMDMVGSKAFDKWERDAIDAVAKLCGDADITMKSNEFRDFIAWAVENFGIEMRRIIDSGDAPF